MFLIFHCILIWPIVVTFECNHYLFFWPFTGCGRVWMCRFLKALGKPVAVYNLYVLDGWLMDYHTTSFLIQNLNAEKQTKAKI